MFKDAIYLLRQSGNYLNKRELGISNFGIGAVR